jgi:aldehyde:ferredoxin oxidoreductase
MMQDYTGKLLRVDLTEGRGWDETLNPAYVADFIGGSGLAARYLLDMVDAKTDPLGPANPLVFMTGPMVGTIMPSAGRYSVCALSPLTGLWGEANAGGFFGPELRFSGYDGILITGASDSPVWLALIDGVATIRDATPLWGLDTYVTQSEIQNLLDDPKARVACIGPAGEALVPMAAIMNDHGRAAGRSGMGAVMGSKRLKAIAVRGRDKPPVAEPERLQAVVREIIRETNEDVSALSLRMAGTAGYWDMGLMYGDTPIRYFQQGEWEQAGNLSGILMVEEFQNRNVACYRCPIACGRETRAPSYGVDRVDGPEYETVGALGSLVMVDDLEAVIYAGHLCNAYGLDTISVGSTIALACELAERGVLDADAVGDLTLRYGDAALVHKLIGMIAKREGFGDLLAEGNRALAARFGVPELSATVNGLEVPMHDARAFSGMAAVYALSPRGACHMQGDMYGVDIGQGPPLELGVMPGDRFDDSAEKGRAAVRQMAWRSLYNAMTLCQFQNPGVPLVLEALNAITGRDLDADDVLRIGERILAVKRLINLRRGMTPRDERLPALLTQPLDGPTEGFVPDQVSLLAGAYAELGWDPESGRPNAGKLAELGLDDL